MHTVIVLLSLGLAVAVAAGSLGDHAELITSRNLAADRAERAAAAFIDGCGSHGCEVTAVIAARLDGTTLSGCITQVADGTSVLRVRASVPWTPRVLTGLTPASAVAAVGLRGFTAPATAALAQC